jgi:hypothetical protein
MSISIVRRAATNICTIFTIKRTSIEITFHTTNQKKYKESLQTMMNTQKFEADSIA